MKNILFKAFLNSFTALLVMSFFASAIAAEANKSTLINALIDDGAETFLSPEVAFKLDLKAIDASNVEANFSIAPRYYLYRERIKLEITSPTEAMVAEISLPAGDIKEDANFGKQEVYHHDFKANIKLATAISAPVTIHASYQGCSEKGLCYAPIKKTFTVDLPAASVIAPTTQAPALAGTDNLADTINTADTGNDVDNTTKILKSGNLWLVIAGFFVAGLLLSLTPCVLPMIPILSSIIVGSQTQQASQSQQIHHSKFHAFGLSVAYVLGMALSYTIAGIAAGLSGDLLSQSLQNAWVLGATALLFVFCLLYTSMVLGFLAIHYCLRFLLFLRRFPANKRSKQEAQRLEASNAALLQGMHALAEGDFESAEIAVKHAHDLIQNADHEKLMAALAAEKNKQGSLFNK